jgi:hypothetical protein
MRVTVPLAVSGPIVISVVVLLALALLYVLLRGESDYVEENPDEDGGEGEREEPPEA